MAAAPPSPIQNSSIMVVPEALLNVITCIKCKNILSVCPINTLPDGNGICGRCIDLKKPEGCRNKMYEALLEFLTFPCMNKQYGCMESRLGKNMFEHETKCPNRRINCPTFKNTSCDWIGEIDNLLEHFENNHATCLLKESFELNFVHNYDEVCLLPYADTLFLVKKHGDVQTKMFWCSVQTIFTNEHEKYEYFITLKNSSKGISVELPRKLACSLNDEDGIAIEAKKIQEDLDNPSTIIATIDIIEFSEVSSKPSKQESDYLSASNLEMLKIIECPVCFEYMVPPIYQCAGGHSICGDCKGKVRQCPTCEKAFGDTQNYAVESFTSFLKYPCKNFERGCEFLTSAKEIRLHEKTCAFGSYECPTKNYTSCSWSGLKQEIWNHCSSKHIDHIVECPFVSLPFEDEDEADDEDCFILRFLKNVFLLHYEYNADKKMFYWALQLVGPPEDCKNFFLDLDIIDRSGRNLRIYVRIPCDSLTDKDSAFEEDKSFIHLTYDQVKSMINEVFCFKLSVHKISANN